MYALSAQELLHVWEVALQQHSVDRALTILAMALPAMPRAELLALSVGQRDAHLLTIRERTFGSQLAGFAECPACQERLEFTLNINDIRIAPLAHPLPEQQVHEVTIEGYELHFRLPDSQDLAQIARCGDAVVARNLLVQRCVLQVALNGGEVAIAALPEMVVIPLIKSMYQHDPQAEVQLNLKCPVCGGSWLVMFDIVSFFWSEICAQAKRLLREVHILARAYGWREMDILNMSTARRQFYLEMVT